ncbi:MAG TPA: hypothetical protein VJW20_17220 [Candidatus Angelobacter sp.]|nr:hypothetical protein [Candidatus Angelobacter sp.]
MNHEPKAQASRINITKYVKVATGKSEGWRCCPVVRSSNGRIRADYVLVDRRTEFHKEGALTTSSGMRRENGVENRWAETRWRRLPRQNARSKF